MDASEMSRRETPERGDGAERRAGGGAARAGPALEGALKEREADGEGPELAAALQRIGELSCKSMHFS